MKLSNKQVQAHLKFIELGCKDIVPDEEKEAIISKIEKGGVIKTAPDLMHLNNEQQKFIYDERKR